MWTCSLNSAREPFRPVQNHTWKYCADAHISFGVRAWKKREENECDQEKMKIKMFICCFSLGTYFLMHYKWLSAFQWHSSYVYLSVRPHARITLLCALCAMLSNVCTPTAYVLVYFCYVVCNYRSQINQYKANNRIVYIIYLSGMIQQVHLCALHTHRIITVTGYGYRYYFTFPNAKRSAATFTLFVSSPLLFVLGAKRFLIMKIDVV